MLNSLDLPKAPADTRVVVAMSGGVDSSVVAALLKAEGYDVVGITLQLYDHGAATHRKGACCAGQDIHDARRVANALGIPHYVLDYEARFREAVIDRFAESYLAGETPVPCVECNRAIKFRDLLDTARDLGADVLATGHYVASRSRPGGGRSLHRAADPERDQSYFLYATTAEQLARLRFPLGEMDKAETRRLARRLGLAVAEKADSQDICFVPQGRYRP
jgi:tRNA-specific 2-thiouridylase